MKRLSIFLLLIFSALSLSACGGTATANAATPSAPMVAEDNPVIAEGYLEPVSFANLAFSAGGVVEEVLVAEGGQVQEGDMIAHLENTEILTLDIERAGRQLETLETDLLTELHAAYKEYRSAQEELDNFSPSNKFDGMTPAEAAAAMLEQVDIAREEYEPYYGTEKPRGYVKDLKEALDDAWAYYNHALEWVERDTRFEAAQVRLARAQKNYDDFMAGNYKVVELDLMAAENALERTKLSAPFDGTIADMHLKVGEAVAAGSPVLTLADFSGWIIKTSDLTELDVVNVYEGQNVTVSFDALPDIQLAGVVETISSTFSNVQGDVTYEVTISLQETDPAMRWGMTALIEFGE